MSATANAGKVVDTSQHWTGGSAIYRWRARCACCLTKVDGQGSKGTAGKTLRPMGWAYVRRQTPIDYVVVERKNAPRGGWGREVRGWVCKICMVTHPELAEASDRRDR